MKWRFWVKNGQKVAIFWNFRGDMAKKSSGNTDMKPYKQVTLPSLKHSKDSTMRFDANIRTSLDLLRSWNYELRFLKCDFFRP